MSGGRGGLGGDGVYEEVRVTLWSIEGAKVW